MGTQKRPLSLNPELNDSIIQIAKTGMSLVDSCIAAGVSRRTALNWQKRAEVAMERVTVGGEAREDLTAADRTYLTLLEDVQEAHAQSKAYLLGILTRAAANDRTSAQWLLERVHEVGPTKRTRKTDKTGNTGGRPVGAVSAPDRKQVQAQPPRLRLAGE